MKVFSKNLGYLTLPTSKRKGDVEYLAEGGQGKVYVTKDNKYLLKIYHDSANSIPEEKAKELSQLNHSNIITPIDLLYENKYVGYYMKYLKDTYVLCELFPKGFKIQNNLDYKQRSELVNKLIDLIHEVHKHGFLVIDLNSNNVLSNKKLNELYLIDTDSFQTKNYPAVAIQDAIRDRKIKNNQFNQGSDWFAFACLSFQLYSNVHPYGGFHPSYVKSQGELTTEALRMNDNISVFDKNVNFPPSVDDFGLIPQKHLDWFKNVFIKGERNPPPKSDGKTPITQSGNFIIIKSNDKLNIQEIYTFPKSVQECYFLKGNFIFKTFGGYYLGNKKVEENTDKIPVLNQKGELVFLDVKDNNYSFGEAVSKFDNYLINDCGVYRNYQGKLFFDELQCFNKEFFKTTYLSDLGNTSFFGDNVLFRKYLHRTMAIGFQNGNSQQHFLPEEYDKYKLINGKFSGHFILLHYEKSNKFYQVLYDTKTEESIKSKLDQYNKPNFICLDNGVSVKLNNDSLSVFKDCHKIKKVDNCGLDDTCVLKTNGQSVYFYMNNKFFKANLK